MALTDHHPSEQSNLDCEVEKMEISESSDSEFEWKKFCFTACLDDDEIEERYGDKESYPDIQDESDYRRHGPKSGRLMIGFILLSVQIKDLTERNHKVIKRGCDMVLEHYRQGEAYEFQSLMKVVRAYSAGYTYYVKFSARKARTDDDNTEIFMAVFDDEYWRNGDCLIRHYRNKVFSITIEDDNHSEYSDSVSDSDPSSS